MADKEPEKVDIRTALESDSITESLAGVRYMGAVAGRRVYVDKDEKPIAAIIFVVDPDACKDVLEAMDKLDAKWAEEAKEGGES
jgi:hypothetical protein